MAETSTPPQAVRPSPPPVGPREPLARCPICRASAPVEVRDGPQTASCPHCRSRLTIQLFPRATRNLPPQPASEPATAGEATCQFYPELKAEVICDECGCFLSTRAAIQWADRQLCMPCLHALREEKAHTDYRARLKIWDNRALGLLALLPFSLFTAPVAAFLLVRFRKEPNGWIQRSAFRWWLALILAGLMLAGWITLIVIWIAMVARELT